ncbi:hypothetical protein M3Y97_00742300 [Aphelenchoides bicaudatus]|nr:hypothetical protein M3Y97_00742300 [Aphelenchoides bicaudatus]
MGSGSSIVKSPQVKNIVALTLRAPNILALLDSNGQNGEAYQLINNEWCSGGIESVQDVHYIHAFQMNERPFASPLLAINKNHIVAGARARNAFCYLFGRLDELGVQLITSIYAGKLFSRTTLFFERVSSDTLKPDRRAFNYVANERYMCVSMRGKNILQFPMVASIGKIRLEWLRCEFGPHLAAEDSLGEYIEFTFKGQPFANTSSRFEDMVLSKRLFLSLVRHFSINGFEFIAGMSIKGGYKNDTFFFKATKRPNTVADTNYFLVCPEAQDRLRIFEAPVEASEIIQATIPNGKIKEVKQSYMGCVEVIMQGNPYDSNGDELVETQLNFLDIIERLWSNGHLLRGALQTSFNSYDRNSLLFQTTTEPSRPLFGMALSRSDTLHMMKVNSNIKTLIREVILAIWHKGIQHESDIACGYAIKLRGRPFGSKDTGIDSHEGLHLIACIIEKLQQINWRLAWAIDIGAKLISEDEFHGYSQEGSMLIFTKTC